MIPAIPETAAAAAAADLAAVAAPPYLLNHSYRTFLFGRCLVPAGDVDDEAAFVASMLHDLGLTDEHKTEREFTRSGAELACAFLEQRGWPLERIRLVEQAILRHANLVVEEVPVHRLLQAGAAVDVAGLGSDELNPESLSAIVSAYPRLDFVKQMPLIFLDEAHRHPNGAFAELERNVALSTRFAANPIDHTPAA
ncbi:MAG: HD domain-containing protein [Mycobacterium sp.]|uniref:HD domain-containing protein n=1 Tax=Mycobacterium sp. TaxID=1785 RepID=UPI003C50B710